MTPAEAIAKLDNQLALHGEPVVLRRGMPATTLPTNGFVRGYKPAELVGTIQQGDSRIVLSPTCLTGVFLAALPVKGDKIDVAGATKNIQAAEAIRIGITLVRLNLQVRGE